MSVDYLDPESLSNARDVLRWIASEDSPSLDFSDGTVLSEIVLGPMALWYSYASKLLDLYLASSSLYQIARTPELSDTGAVDRLLSNYNVSRDSGSLASGSITLILAGSSVTSIPAGTIFRTSGGVEFTSVRSFIGVPTAAEVVSADHRLISRRADGSYSMNIQVEATEIGSDRNIRKGTQLSPSASPSNFVRAYAESDFTGGGDAETMPELLERIRYGVAQMTVGSRISMAALLRGQLETVRAVSIIGLGDAEMLRGRHNIVGVSSSGKVDIYVQTQARPVKRTVLKTATLVDASAGDWQISMLRDDAPAYYAVLSILPSGSVSSGTKELISEVRGLDLTGSGFIPSISNMVEGAYTRYQTASIRFRDAETAEGKPEGAEESYEVTVYVLPEIDTLQDRVNNYFIRNPAGDYLVRAPVPCFVSVSIRLSQPADVEDPDTEAMRVAAAEAVNSMGFRDRLPSSVVINACQEHLNGSSILMPIEMMGQIHRPDGTITVVRSGKEIVLPDSPQTCTTSRTALFFLDPEDIDISITEQGGVRT